MRISVIALMALIGGVPNGGENVEIEKLYKSRRTELKYEILLNLKIDIWLACGDLWWN